MGKVRLLLCALCLTFVSQVFAQSEGWVVNKIPLYPLQLEGSVLSACRAYNGTVSVDASTIKGWLLPGSGVAGHCEGTTNGIHATVNWLTYYHCPTGSAPRWPGRCEPFSSYLPVSNSNRPRDPLCSPASPDFSVGNPIRPGTGEKAQDEVDLVLIEGFELKRFYRSKRAAITAGHLGALWSYSFERSFLVDENRMVTIVFGDGTLKKFKQSGSLYVDEDTGATNLVRDGEEWRLHDHNGTIEIFRNAFGEIRLTSLVHADGRRFDFTYGNRGRLLRVTSRTGRTVEFETNDLGVVTDAKTRTQHVGYEYEPMKWAGKDIGAPATRLKQVSQFDSRGRVLAFKKYEYLDEDGKRHLLSGIIDERDVRFARFEYDEALRATVTSHANRANQYEVEYVDKDTRKITDPIGTKRTYQLTNTKRGVVVASIDQPPGSGCAAAVKSMTYSDLGPSSVTDFTGAKTCIFRDAVRGLEVRRVEGLASGILCEDVKTRVPDGARVTTTSWHPNWYLPIAVATPLKTIRNIYNGQIDVDGRLANCTSAAPLPGGLVIAVICRRIEQSTGDENGSLGIAPFISGLSLITTFMYNERGQVLTQRTRTNNLENDGVRRYVYYEENDANHSIGDLAAIELPTGRTRRFIRYTVSGVPLQIDEENGVATAYVYDDLGRIVEHSRIGGVNSRKTSYSYNEIGEVSRETSSNGVERHFFYDEAHRLTAIKDAKGNRTEFVLDELGNVIRERIEKEDGSLVRFQARAFDALNRLRSQITEEAK